MRVAIAGGTGFLGGALVERLRGDGHIRFSNARYFFLTRDSDALAPIGLISFAGIAQFVPALLAALFWRVASLLARWQRKRSWSLGTL